MRQNRGIIKFILIIVVAVIILSYLNVDVNGVVSKTMSFFKDVWALFLQYLK